MSLESSFLENPKKKQLSNSIPKLLSKSMFTLHYPDWLSMLIKLKWQLISVIQAERLHWRTRPNDVFLWDCVYWGWGGGEGGMSWCVKVVRSCKAVTRWTMQFSNFIRQVLSVIHCMLGGKQPPSAKKCMNCSFISWSIWGHYGTQSPEQ